MPDASWLAAKLADTGTRLRAAITAAEVGNPLRGVVVPENRHKVPDIDPARPIVLLRMPRFGRRSLGDSIPAFEVSVSFSFDVLVASGRGAETLLDQRMIDLLDAIDGVLFEDAEWVAQWNEVVSADAELLDGEVNELDVQLAQVTIVVTLGREYHPNVATVLEGIGVTDPEDPDAGTKAGVVVAPVAGHPDERHRIAIDFDVPPPEPEEGP